MRNYKIKNSKRNIKKVFKRVFGDVYVTFTIHLAKDYGYRKPSVGLMRYMLICHWRWYCRRYLAGYELTFPDTGKL